MENFSASLSIVIPVFNEEKRLQKTFLNLDNFLNKSDLSKLEIIFVDDGSTDNTVKIVNDFLKTKEDNKQMVWRFINSSPNKGKGWAVKQGMLASSNDFILMLDADMSTPITEWVKAIPLLQSGVQVVSGSRRGLGANLIISQPWYRRQMGNLYAVLARFITGLDILDFGCGFKIFSKQAAQDIFKLTKINGWIFDTEALFLAKKMGYRIGTIGVDWTDDRDTRVKIVSSIFTSLVDLIKIRLFHY